VAFAVGVSVGRTGEPSAIAVLDVTPTTRQETYPVTVVDTSYFGHRRYTAKRTRTIETAPCSFAVRHLERFLVGASYSAIAEATADIVRRLDGEDVITVTDVTGVSLPVLALFYRQGLAPFAVTVMAGGHPTLSDGGYAIPKGALVSLLQIALHDGRLKIAAGLPDADALRAELVNFRPTTTGQTDTEAWRDGAHDDMVFAVAVAAFVAEDLYTRTPAAPEVEFEDDYEL
jgi:hypothetical protein